ncbi:MAG TPA: flagellar hook-length control protein FliK [Rhizomicrobium sp.]|nr:flagellar hook-length control protein FliK [Rhizomicrobium sp.]
MAVIAAHADATKATAHAHGAMGAQASAVPADEAALFADLLSKTGDVKADAAADPEALLSARKTDERPKKSKDAADSIPGTADIQIQPSQLVLLSAGLSGADGKTTPADRAANDNSDAVNPADGAKALLNRILDAKNKSPAGNNPTANNDKSASNPIAADALGASAGNTPASNTANTNTPPGTVKVADATQSARPQAPTSVELTDAIGLKSASQPATAPGENDKTDKAGTNSKSDVRTAAKDAVQTSTPDKADALAAAADKSVRQSAATQGSQARAVPMQPDAQAASNPNTGGGTGADGKGSSQSSAQHAKNDAGTQPQPDAVQSASQAPVNTANAPQSTSHAPVQTDNVQPVTAPAHTQTSSPVVTASLQVTQQTAQNAAQPDVTGLAVQIAAKSGEGVKHFDIRLDPPELGRVEVRLSIDDTGHAQAHLAVEKPQTLDMLQNDRSNLERALKDSGVNLSQNGLNFSLKGQEKQSGNAQAPRSRNLAVTAAIEATTAAVAASNNSYATGDARLDIRV